MGIFGKRKERGGAESAPPASGGIRDFSGQAPPDFASDLGPPATRAMGGVAPPPAAPLGDEGDMMGQAGAAPSAPPLPQMAAAMPPPPPAIPTTTFEPSPIGGGGDLAMAA